MLDIQPNTDAHTLVQTIIEGGQTAYLLDGSVATTIVESLETLASVNAAAERSPSSVFASDREALVAELGRHHPSFLMVEPLTPGMDKKDTGGLVCSCGEWSFPAHPSGLRPLDRFTQHQSEAILALGFDRNARASAAAGWAEGVETALNHAIRNPDGITLRLEHLDGRPWQNPHGPAATEGANHG